MKSQTHVDIVIPLYNEEKVIARSVSTLLNFLKESAFPYSYTLILANNASTDRSGEICKELEAGHGTVKALDLGKKGKGYAIRTAWAQSSADVLVFMDTDLSSDLNYLRMLIDPVIQGKTDLAIGNRLGKDSVLISHKKTRKIASRLYNVITRSLLGTRVDDHQCGFKAMKRESFAKIAPHLISDGFSIDSEIIAFSQYSGLSVSSVDIVWRDSPTSKVSLVKDSIKMFRDAMSLRKRLKSIHS